MEERDSHEDRVVADPPVEEEAGSSAAGRQRRQDAAAETPEMELPISPARALNPFGSSSAPPEEEFVEVETAPCSLCGRSFSLTALPKHARICEKVRTAAQPHAHTWLA